MSTTYKATARAIKLAGSLVFYVVASLWRAGQALLGTKSPGACVVLCYHAVPGNERSRFARQMDLLCRYVKPIRADVAAPLPSGNRYAAVTFDDAYQSTVQNALPELQTRKIPCTIFVAPKLLGECPPWAGTPGFSYDDKVINCEQLRSVSNDLVLVGSHTLTHATLPSLSEDEAREELCESRKMLESMLGCKVRLLAFPHGAFNESVVRYCREAGYERVFSIERKMAFSGAHEYLTGRTSTDPSDWEIEFRLKLFGAYSWVPAFTVAKRKAFAWLSNSRRVSYHAAG